MNYSHSKISTFEDCPLKYKYQYRDRLSATLGDTIEAYLGRRVHESLEKLYNDLKVTRLLTLEELLNYYESLWEKHWKDNIRVIKRGFSPEDYRKLGRKCLNDYYRSYQPFDQGRTLGVERNVQIELGPGRILRGVIDRLVAREEGFYEIHDYKTSGYLPTQKKIDGDRQLALYQIAVQSMWDDARKVELVWHYLVFDKELRSNRKPEQLVKLTEGINALIDTIESAEEFEPKPSALCDWCEYKNICPVWKHEFALKELSPEGFKKDDGVRLVDRYQAIQKEEKRLEKEKNTLKESLADFCAAFGYRVVYGTDHKISVKRSTTLQFPPAGAARRKELEELIRRAGQWNELSMLNLNKLEKALREGILPSALADSLKLFYEEKESIRLSSSKIKSEE